MQSDPELNASHQLILIENPEVGPKITKQSYK